MSKTVPTSAQHGDEASLSFADPIPELAEKICEEFLFDAKSLLKLGGTSPAWHRIVNDSAIWERLIAARFGPEDTPPPARPASALPGWCFFPGMDSNGHDCAKPEDAGWDLSPAALAAIADQRGGVAFNTNGWVKDSLLPLHRWCRFSVEPGVGLYVRERAVPRMLGAPPPAPLPEQAEPQARPPEIPGWLFYPLQESPNHSISHPATGEDHFLGSCRSVADLAAVAAAFPECVAFTTRGQLKHNLERQVHWHRPQGLSSWHGMYVRQDAAAARGLLPLPEGCLMDPRLRYFQRGPTRLLAARDVDVTWLNGTYLLRKTERLDPTDPRDGDDDDDSSHSQSDSDNSDSEYDDDYPFDPSFGGYRGRHRRPMGGRGAAAVGSSTAAAAGDSSAGDKESGASSSVPPPPRTIEVVELRSVCWLNLAGSFYGVSPGRYRVLWHLRVTPECNVGTLHTRVKLKAARTCNMRSLGGTQPQEDKGKEADAGGAGPSVPKSVAAVVAAVAAAGQKPPAPGSTLVATDVQSQRYGGAHWSAVSCGVFEVPEGSVYDVEVVMWNHEGHWKTGLVFRELQLRRLGEGEEAEGEEAEAEAEGRQEGMGGGRAQEPKAAEPRSFLRGLLNNLHGRRDGR